MKPIETHIEELQNLLSDTSQKIVLVSHKNPDCDTIGATLGLTLLLERQGFQHVQPVLPNHYPEFLAWLPGIDRYIIASENDEPVQTVIASADIIFCIDFNNYERVTPLGKYLKKSTAIKLLIDHHPNPDDVFEYALSKVLASSASELTYEFIALMGWQGLLDQDIATNLYAGIMTDTGCFSFNSSQPETFKIVAHLLEQGIDKDEIYDRIYNSYSEERMRWVGYSLYERMEVLSEKRTAFFAIPANDLERFNNQIGDEEGMVNIPLSIKGVQFAVIMIERPDYIKMSFRSKKLFPANYVAKRYFHGGGHLNAAGGKSYKTLPETVEKLKKILNEDTALQSFFK